MPLRQIIVGSTRETRAADLVIPWVRRSAEKHGGFEVEVLDLRDWPLPMFQEHAGTSKSRFIAARMRLAQRDGSERPR